MLDEHQKMIIANYYLLDCVETWCTFCDLGPLAGHTNHRLSTPTTDVHVLLLQNFCFISQSFNKLDAD
jgi:hypothetical protein